MSDTRYFQYSVAQYVHWRRDERLNVGLVIYDPLRKWVYSFMDSTDAVRRVKHAFPDLDRVGLQLALQDLDRTLSNDDRIRSGLEKGHPLEYLEHWQNMIRFTQPKVFPATTVQQAATRLKEIFVDDPTKTGERPVRASVLWAKRRTSEAIQKVLNPVEGFGLTRDFEVPLTGDSALPLRFPFLVLGSALIDTLAFDSENAERSQAFAHHFIRKVEELSRAVDNYRAFATVSLNQRNPDGGRKLIQFVRKETGLADEAIVEAEEAEVMLENIKASLLAA
jgi:hypothetical protein